MPSRASFFSPAVYRKNLTRFAPLWIAYLVFWLVAMPLKILAHRGDAWYTYWNLRGSAIASVKYSAIACMAYAILVAMALHSWYYRSASVNALAALPIRRKTWFCTNLLTALTMGLVPNLIVALAICGAAAVLGISGGMAALTWLAITSLVYVFFYALAALCAAVVGQILALPALYLLVNFTAVVVNYVTVTILSTFVYGMNAHYYTILAPLSPVFYLLSRNSISYDFIEGSPDGIERVSFMHWGYLLGLTAAAVIMLAIAFLLFRRRRMESAGDTIAVRPLRPVFKYCFATGCALVLGTLAAYLTFFQGVESGMPVKLLLCLLAGGFVGYFTAEILLQKTFRVFGREWIGFGVFSLCLTAAVVMMEFDVTGFERRVPNIENVESISVNVSGGYGSFTVDDPALISDIMALHQSIIRDKRNQDDISRRIHGYKMVDSVDFQIDSLTLYLDYHLRNGKVMERQYVIRCSKEQWDNNLDSPARLMVDLFSDPAIVHLAVLPDFPIQGPENILYAEVRNHAADVLEAAGEENRDTAADLYLLTLSQEEAWQVFTTCVLPDLRDGRIGKPNFYYFQNEPEYYAEIQFRFVSASDMYYPNCLTLTPGSRTAQYFIDRGCVLLTEDEVNALWETLE